MGKAVKEAVRACKLNSSSTPTVKVQGMSILLSGANVCDNPLYWCMPVMNLHTSTLKLMYVAGMMVHLSSFCHAIVL